ncbi:MAG TPA: hypothetical protein VKW76_12245 [Candidatus Binatia bacterium]|nr:hypothetical protein [Candidatus Binatia bacterium]
MVVALYAGTLVGCTTTKPPPPPALAPPAAQSPSTVLSGQLGDQTLVATATVLRIDRKTRHVTLKRPDGTKFTIVAGPEVRNLPQVQKGDVVRITYRESIAYDVKKPGSTGPGITASSDVSRAPEGEKPAGSATDTVTVRMTIAAIDKATSEATLRGPRGDVVVVKAKDPTKLDMVSVGDVVEITYTEALAVRVEKAGTL